MADTPMKYRVVRRGKKWCVRVKGVLNTADTFWFCRKRKMSYHIKKHNISNKRAGMEWDYDFIFDRQNEVTTFILGCLV